jgi:hypothetical protein
MLKKIHLLLLVSTFLLGTNIYAGVVFEVETKDHEQSPARVSTMEIQVEGVNVTIPNISDDKNKGKMTLIFRGDRGKHGQMIIVDHDEKNYFVMDDTTMQVIAEKLGTAMSAMEEALKNVPAEQREMMEKMLKERGIQPAAPQTERKMPEVKKTGQGATKQGYPCVKYDVFKDGRKIRDVWTADWNKVDGGKEAMNAFVGMATFFQELWKSMPQMPGGADPLGGENPFEQMNFKNGYPVETTGFATDGSVKEESKLMKTRRQRIDPAAFEPPSGYKRTTMDSP